VKATLKSLARAAGLRRSRLAAARLAVERHMLARRSPAGPLLARPRILCYHSVGTPAWGVNDVPPERFRAQIALLIEAGARFRPAGDVWRDGRPGDIALTFDDGLASVARNAAPLLADYGIPWTLCVVTAWADGRHSFGDGVVLGWAEIERLAARGATIASHSVSHPDFGALPREAARRELVASREAIRTRLGIETSEFAIPFGCARNWSAAAQEEALAAGYTTIYAQAEARRAPNTVPRTFITRYDGPRLFRAALVGAFDDWEEWL
jgi:peptidoglycan/xylan/chitin deacetylase (PgdA/CDA1 family)